MQELSKLLLDGDTAAIQRSRDLGQEALATLEAYSAHHDDDVRFLVVECLVAQNTNEAGRRLVRFCEDASPEVQLEAIHGLLESEPIAGIGHELFGIYDRLHDGHLRRQIALVLGRLPAKETQSRLAAKLHGLDRASDGLIAALARHGDPNALARLGEILCTARDDRIVETLQLFRYVAHRDCGSLLLPLLERGDVAQHVQTPMGKVERRTCDLALDELLRLHAAALSFPARDDLTAYSADELAEAQALLRKETSP